MSKNRQQGFTLIEVLLVLVIISIVIYAAANYLQQKSQQMRIDRTTLQMQQILNAGLSYYVNNGSWPTTLTQLQTGGYLPPGTITSPWGSSYTINGQYSPNTNTQPPMFYVYTTIPAPASTSGGGSGGGGGGTTQGSSYATAIASIIAGTLPLSYTSTDTGSPTTPPDATMACSTTTPSCTVVASVNIPGQDLNNASSVNYTGIYHHGACVPVPQCPPNLVPQIMVVPTSVSGVNYPPGTNNSSGIYPISSFTAYATPQAPAVPNNTTPPDCRTGPPSVSYNPTNGQDCALNTTDQNVNAYWRVCMQVVTEIGDVSQTNTGTDSNLWGGQVSVLAITRCAIPGEAVGSEFSVYSN